LNLIMMGIVCAGQSCRSCKCWDVY